MDGETVRAVFQYEQMREQRSAQQAKEQKHLTCKRCGLPLPTKSEIKRGRDREQCIECESQ